MLYLILAAMLALQLVTLRQIRKMRCEMGKGYDDLKASVDAETAQSMQIVATLTDMDQQIADLKAAVAAGSGVTDDQLESLATTLKTAQDQVAAKLNPAPPTT